MARVVASLTREPRRRQEMVEADGDGDAPDTRSALVEVVRAYRGNQDTLARRCQEHDDDIRRHGPSPSSRPVSPEAERLRDGLRGMEAGAEKVRKLIELAPLVGLAPEDLLERLVAELPPNGQASGPGPEPEQVTDRLGRLPLPRLGKHQPARGRSAGRLR